MSACFLGFSGTAAEHPSEAASARSRFGELPLYFEANRGQADERVQYFARGPEHTIYLESGGATIALSEGSPPRGDARSQQFSQTNNPSVRFIRMTLVGANPHPVVEEQGKLSGKVNYLLGNDPAEWQKAVPTFARVQYNEVYPGVDLIYYGNQQELEYDFLVAPGGDPSVITLRFEGADRLQIDPRGDLLLHLGPNQLRQHQPVVYQTIAGVRHEVPGRYRLQDARTVTFALGRYDRSRALVIDPVLSYSTYLGGSKGDIGWAIAVDSAGSAYVAGDTLSIIKKLPISTNGPGAEFGGGSKFGGDAFVAKLDFDTGTLALSLGYLTYLGGNGLDGAVGIALDNSGAAYLTGYTTSSNFPAFPAGVLQNAIAGERVKGFNSHYSDAFVTKLDPDGQGVYSTYLGGELAETGVDIAVDPSGSAYVVGYTDSALTFVITNQAGTVRCTNSICGGPSYVTNITTTRLLVASQSVTNLIGSNVTATATNVIETIVTTALLSPIDAEPVLNGFPIVNALQTNNHSRAELTVGKKELEGFTEVTKLRVIHVGADLFISKISPDGSALVYSTYLGGFEDDFGTGIAVDADGSAVITGYTASSDFPVANAFQSTLGGGRDAIVARIDPAGGALVYSTYLGGARNDAGYGIDLDASGAAYVTGAEGSIDFPSTPGAYNRGGVFQSTDAAAEWNASSSGLTHTTIQALLADPTSAATLYAGTPRGVFKTIDGGVTWTPSNIGLVSSVNALALDPAAPSTLYAGTSGGLFKSTDAGNSWTNTGAGLPSAAVRAILYDASSSLFYVGTARGIFKSTDVAATNWIASSVGLRNRSVNALALDPGDPTIVYAATDGGVYKSTNSAANWRSSNQGLKATQSRAIAIDPSNTENLYLGTARGLYTSVNAATNWNRVILTNFAIGVNALLIDPNLPSTVYAGTTFGLYKSLDTGASWMLSQSNLTSHIISALVFPSATTSTIYAGTRGIAFAGGTNDAFLVKFAPNGSSLGYALTFGGSRNDEGWDVAVHSDGSAYVIGQTASRDFPVVYRHSNAPPYFTNFNKRIDAFVSQFDPTGATNIFSILLGGKGYDFGQGIALDPDGNAYIVGRTQSSKFFTTNGLQTIMDRPLTFGGGKRDAFVAKLDTGLPASLGIRLSFDPAGDHVVVSWSALGPASVLECCATPQGNWMPVAQKATAVNGRRNVVLPASAAGCFFRLRKP